MARLKFVCLAALVFPWLVLLLVLAPKAWEELAVPPRPTPEG